MKKARSTSSAEARKSARMCPLLGEFIKYHEEDLRKLKAVHRRTATSPELCDIMDIVSVEFGDLGGQWLIAPNEHANTATPLDLLVKGKLSEVRDVLICELYSGRTMSID